MPLKGVHKVLKCFVICYVKFYKMVCNSLLKLYNFIAFFSRIILQLAAFNPSQLTSNVSIYLISTICSSTSPISQRSVVVFILTTCLRRVVCAGRVKFFFSLRFPSSARTSRLQIRSRGRFTEKRTVPCKRHTIECYGIIVVFARAVVWRRGH